METGLQNPTPEKAAPVWEKAFLSALSEAGVVRYACKAAGVDPSAVYDRRREVPEFAAAWAQALDDAADLLESEAVRRGRDGIVETVVGKNGEVYENTKYSDTLLIFLLKGARPEKYRERFDTKLSGSLDIGTVVAAAHASAIGGADE